MIYGEQQCSGRASLQAAASPGRPEPLPLLLIHTFPAQRTLEGPFLFTWSRDRHLTWFTGSRGGWLLGWLLRYLLNGNQGGEISHISCQPSAKCCLFCLEQLEVVLTGRQGPGAGDRGGRKKISGLLKCRNRHFIFLPQCLFVFHFLSSSFFFFFCFKYKIPSVDSNYKPSACFHNSIYCPYI